VTDQPKFPKSAASETTSLQRRSLLTNGLRFSLAATLLGTTTARAALCVDPEELGGVDYSFRKYVEYTESSPHKDKSCSGCNSFQPPAEGDCGTCRAVAGSINKNGHCTGWEARAVGRDSDKKK
jgi:hypothetical protein